MTTTEHRTALLDVNVLVALVWDMHLHHVAARRQFAGVEDDFATTPVTESGLVRLLLTPAVVGRVVSGVEAVSAVRGLRAMPGWRWLPDDGSLADPAVDIRVLIGRQQVTDLHLLDLAARHRCTLVTFDTAMGEWVAPADGGHLTVWRP